MRLSEVLREAWRNIASGASGPLWLASAFAIAMVAGVVLPALVMSDVSRSYRGMLESGSATTIVRAIEGIDARACVALGDVTGVVGAAAIRHETSGLSVAALPRFEQTHIEVAGDLVAVLGGRRAAGSGVYVSSVFAEQLGVVAGDDLALTAGNARIAGVFEYPDDGRHPVLGSAIVVPVPADDRVFTECWVTVWPPDQRHSSLFLTVLRGESPSQPAEIQILNGTAGHPRALSTLIEESPVDLLEGGAVSVSALLGAVWLRTRRTDLALRMHLGQGRLAQCLQSCVEAAIPVTVVGAFGVVIGYLVSIRILPPEDSAWIAGVGAATAGAAVVAVLAGVCVASLTIRDRRLGDWSRER